MMVGERGLLRVRHRHLLEKRGCHMTVYPPAARGREAEGGRTNG
jgi:hypothetical protein